jgi:hypothetical protein
MSDREAIIKAALEGVSLRGIGRKFDCTVQEVAEILDEFAATSLKPAARARRLVYEVERLDALQTVFHAHAIATRDAAAGKLVVDISRRKSALLGLDQPRRLDMTVIEPAQYQTGHDKVKRVIEELCRLPAPQPLAEDEGEDQAVG